MNRATGTWKFAPHVCYQSLVRAFEANTWKTALEPTTQLLIAATMMAGMMTVLWLIEVARNDASVVDVGWSAGLGVLAIFFAITSDGDPPRRWLVGVLAALWSFRLAGYLLFNRVIGKEEDGRYQNLRKRWGGRAHFYFFFFFQAQALLDVLFGIPLLIAMTAPRPDLDPWDFAGAAVLLVAVFGEMIADGQLARFRRDPGNRGKVCDVGLWRYSRHPNYFFEWLHWWAYVLFAVGHAYWWGTLFAPALMLYFLFYVTGIPATEAHALRSRGDAYRRYQRTTSVFIPWFPKESP
jgi:steroid 5-alpha reductase family enzyme